LNNINLDPKLNLIYRFLKKKLAKISVLLFFGATFLGCDVVKRVKSSDYLLTQNDIYVNGKKTNSESINRLSFQKTNSSILGFPFRLHFYNLARSNKDSLFEHWIKKRPKREERLIQKLSKKQVIQLKKSAINFNSWIKTTGQAPELLDSLKIRKTKLNLERYYFGKGWFNRKVDYKVALSPNKRAQIRFDVETGQAYKLDSISSSIEPKVIDSLFTEIKSKSLLKKGDQFDITTFENERLRITNALRNSGVYHFSQDYVRFENDTIDTKNQVDVTIKIENRIIRNEDSITRVPFKIFKIKDVNIFTDASFDNRSKPIQDSIQYENYNIYSFEKLKYKPKALTSAIIISKNDVYRDLDRTRTYRYLNDLRTFKYPNIEYTENETDSTLTANIYLNPKKKYGLGFDVNVSQSNIQKIGFSFSSGVVVRNIFKGAETLQISALGAIGASKDGATGKSTFFDINELGADIKLNIPRLFFPFNTKRIIPKYMSPSTQISAGFTSQTNIGLDKQTINGVLGYKWHPNERVTNSLELIDMQYVRNLNPGNYFGVYQNSFNRLKTIATEIYPTPSQYLTTNSNGDTTLDPNFVDAFMDLVGENGDFQSSNPTEAQTVRNIKERKNRLTQNNFILASSFNYLRNQRENTLDTDFSILRLKLEFAGNLLYGASKWLNLKSNSTGNYLVNGVPFSQYIKSEIDYIKLWDIDRNNVIAFRSFFGAAIPLGNSSNIPFSESFFAGGSNDNRAWTAYNLGPGSSDVNNEFNEANMKIAFSLEHRYNMFGNFKGAFFIDAGNIWNVLDDVEDPKATFNGLSSLKDIAVGAGFGLRYDFDLFILRLDLGFKAYDPTYGNENRWFNDFNFGNVVYNIGINYPF
jgi:outer membrane protein assembly factor BamA